MMDTYQNQDSDPCFLHIPFTHRWEYLKPVIEQLYVNEGRELSFLVKTMKESYKLDAS
jgi:Clr5 domain